MCLRVRRSLRLLGSRKGPVGHTLLPCSWRSREGAVLFHASWISGVVFGPFPVGRENEGWRGCVSLASFCPRGRSCSALSGLLHFPEGLPHRGMVDHRWEKHGRHHRSADKSHSKVTICTSDLCCLHPLLIIPQLDLGRRAAPAQPLRASAAAPFANS